MPRSTISSDSLSSPSPSLPPTPKNKRINKESNPARPDSDSELSELTEEEQDVLSNEQEDADDDEGNVDARKKRPARRNGTGVGRRRRGLVPAPMWDWATKKKEGRSPNPVEEEEEEDAADPPKAMEEEEEEDEIEDEDEDNGTLATNSRARQDGDISDDKDRASTRRRNRSQAMRPMYPNGADNQYHGSEIEDDDDDSKSRRGDEDQGDLSDTVANQQDDTGESENEVETEDEDEDEDLKEPDAIENEAASAATSSTLTSKQIKPSLTSSRPPDPDGLVKSPLAAAVTASSIMAGSNILRPPSSSSNDSYSVNSSRSPSPTSKELTGNAASKRDSKQKAIITAKQGEGRSLAGKQPDSQAEDDVPDQDGSVDDIEADEPSPEQDLDIELESDLQPAHRAEALDVLAQIELRFALLRERVYVEKMEALAWEESLVLEENHPEQIHMQAELEKRRNKRLELGLRKRSFEVANVVKRRRLDEDATWNWWKVARDELQFEMIAEANRKRRKLERERRAIERSPPLQRIPSRPQEIPAAPSLRQVVKSSSLGGKQTRTDQHSRANSSRASYPELTALNTGEIASDLDFLYQNRRLAYENHRMHTINAGVGAPVGYDPYGSLLDNTGGPNRMALPQAPFHPQHQLPPPGVISQPVSSLPPPYNGANTSRSQHQLQPAPAHNLPPQFQDQDMSGPNPPPGGNQHHAYFGSSQGGPHPNQNHAVGGMRRSMSPPVHTNGVGKPVMHNGNWSAPGSSKHPNGPNEWDARREMNFEEEEREREREIRREKEKARERTERDREVEMERERHHAQYITHQQQQTQQQLQRQHHRHPPSQQSLHNHPPQGAPVHHHHHHHHHIVHNHHPSQPNNHGAPSVPTPTSISSPRSQRESESGRPQSNHPSDGAPIPVQSKVPPPHPHWKNEDPQLQPPEFRGDHRDRSRPRPTSAADERDRDRPLAFPFVLSPPHTLPAPVPTLPPPPNGTLPSGQSRRGSWSHGDDGPYRLPPAYSSYLSGPDNHRERDGPGSPNAHRYPHHVRPAPAPAREHSRQNSAGQSPPRSRVLPPLSSPNSSGAYPHSRSPVRYGPPPPPPPQQTQQLSPASSPASNVKAGLFPPRLGGPGGHNQPPISTGANETKNGFRATSPSTRVAYSPINVNVPNRSIGDKLSPRLMAAPPPAKLGVPQMVDSR